MVIVVRMIMKIKMIVLVLMAWGGTLGNAAWVGNFKLRKISKTQEDNLKKPGPS